MANVPNLYLKWAVFKDLIQPAQSDAQIAKTLFADQFGVQDASESNRPILFSRMLRGEYGMQPEIASKLAKRMNASIEVYRGDHDLGGPPERPLAAADLYSSLFEFMRRLINAVETSDPDELTRVQQRLFHYLAPKGPEGNPAKLLVQRMAIHRFEPFQKPPGPVIFNPGRDVGQLSIEGLVKAPVAAYAFIARDPGPKHKLWDLPWRDSILWMPSPFELIPADGRFNLFPAPQPLKRDEDGKFITGRFIVTAAVVLDKRALAELDPRGKEVSPGILDENQTATFLTNARRLAERKNPPLMLATNEYTVVE
jgi:hypothetical protein